VKTFLFFAAIFLFGLALLIGAGVATGMVLHWLLPVIGFGTSVLIGVVGVALTFQTLTRLMLSLPVVDEEGNEEAGGRTPSDAVYLVGGMAGRRRRRRKSGR
jgi:divalent metal cation (Fe/Co/Zn/Cd) transporter